MLSGDSIRAVLLDVEGTTTSVEFVYRTLFPYARRHIGEFLNQHLEDGNVRADLLALRNERGLEDAAENDAPPWSSDSPQALVESAVQYALWLMDRDRKSTALKALQGRIWYEGYHSGELRGHVYPDVPVAFERWAARRKKIGIFSSGSEEAQQLLFYHSTAGDLSRYIGGYFDTTVGHKREAESYQKIAGALGYGTNEVLYISDSEAEIKSAEEAGMRTALCEREKRQAPLDYSRPVLTTFDEIFP
jgi:enolase-phosphatase E1